MGVQFSHLHILVQNISEAVSREYIAYLDEKGIRQGTELLQGAVAVPD